MEKHNTRAQIRQMVETQLDPGGVMKADVASGLVADQGIRAYAEEIMFILEAAFSGDFGLTVDDLEDYVTWLVDQNEHTDTP